MVDVDNAVRTSDNELALAVEEFGDKETAPFSQAVADAKTTLAQAFNVRQILDDAVPETPAQRRDLLTRVIVAAAKADRELDAQREAFAQLRDLVINAPTRLDAMTQQMVDLTARLEPSQQTLTALHNAVRRYRAGFGGRQCRHRQAATGLRRPEHHDRAQSGRHGPPTARPGSSTRSGRRSRRWARRARCSTRWTAPRPTSTVRSPRCPRRSPTSRTASRPQAINWRKATSPHAADLGRARDAAVKAVADAQSTGTADPLGAFTKLTQADAELDRLLASVAEEREAAERLSRAFDQALFSAQSRVRAVSDFIDIRRGSIGPEARTRLAEAVRQLQAAQDKRADKPHRGDRARQRRGDAGVAGAVDGQRRRRSGAARVHRPLRQQPAGPTWARCSAASSSATS